MSEDAHEFLQSLADVMFPAEPDTPVRIDSVGYDGDTPLHVVAWRNDLEAVRLLIGAGADVNATGEMNETPLHIAVGQGNVQMVRALLQAGARADIKSEFGVTASERASEQGGELAEILATATPPNNSLERTREG